MYLRSFDDMKKTSEFFLLKPSRSTYILIITLFFSIIIFFVWSNLAITEDTVKADVILRPDENISSIKCVMSGEISDKYFENNNNVKEGDLLFCLDTSSYLSQKKALQNALKKNHENDCINELFFMTIEKSKIPDFDEFLTSVSYNFENETILKQDALIKCRSYINESQSYENNIASQKDKIQRELTKPESLIVPQTIKDLRIELNQMELAFGNWKNSQKLETLEIRKRLEADRDSLESKISEINRIIKNSTIYAPITGRIVETSKLNIGDYLLSGEEVLKIIPENSSYLKADIYVDACFAARLKVGDSIKIKFPGLPPSRYGILETKISLVPPDGTFQNGEIKYIAQAEIVKPYLMDKNGKAIKLIPGMFAEGRIIIDRCTVMQMILRKLDFIN